jgi:acyl carrier protein
VHPAWIALGVGVLISVALTLQLWSQKRVARARLGRRPQLTPAEFGERYFSDSTRKGQMATTVRRILANHLDLPLDGILPEDGLVQDLRMDDFDSMSTVEFILEIEQVFGVEIPDGAAKDFRSLRDIVEYLDAHHGWSGTEE